MSGSEDQSEWQRAYDASIAEQVARAQVAAAELDPARRWAIELRAGFFIFITLLGFAGLGADLLVSGPWYVSARMFRLDGRSVDRRRAVLWRTSQVSLSLGLVALLVGATLVALGT